MTNQTERAVSAAAQLVEELTNMRINVEALSTQDESDMFERVILDIAEQALHAREHGYTRAEADYTTTIVEMGRAWERLHD